MTFEDIVKKVRALPVEKRKELINLIIDSLTQPELAVEADKPRIVGPDGAGPEIWQEADPQDVIHKLHIEWDDRA